MTVDRSCLNGLSVLVIEDEYLIADDLARELRHSAASVVGPFGTLDDARQAVSDTSAIDAAILDINLHGLMAHAILDRLKERQIPIVLATGYDQDALPDGYRLMARCEKPASASDVVDRLAETVVRMPKPRIIRPIQD